MTRARQGIATLLLRTAHRLDPSRPWVQRGSTPGSYSVMAGPHTEAMRMSLPFGTPP